MTDRRVPVLTRRRLLKTGAAVGGAAAIAPLLAACAPSGGGGGTGGGTQAGPITIRVWGFGLDDTRAKERLAVFTKANPNIKIENAGGSLNRQQVLTAVISGDPPEVIRIGNRGETPAWAARNAVQELDDLVSRDKFNLSDFAPSAVEQSKYKGKLYGIPEFAHVELLYINVDTLKDAQGGAISLADIDPGDWNKMERQAKALAKLDGGKITRLGWEQKLQDGSRWYMWAKANGIDAMTPDGLKANFNTPQFIEVLTYAKRFVDAIGGENARLAFNQTENFFSAQNYILTGQVAMRNFESWLIGTLKLKKDANITAMVPRKKGSKDGISQTSGSTYAIPRGVSGAKRDAAWEFIKAFTSTDAWVNGEKAVYAAEKAKTPPGDYHPTNTANEKADQVILNEIYKPVSPGIDAIVKVWPDARKVALTVPSGPVQDDIDSEAVKKINDVLQGKLDPAKAAADLQTFAEKTISDFAKTPGVR
jgi:multiple sugar transport system substrate-binding protein